MSDDGPLREYVRALEGRFRRLRGSPLLVSPRDFALMLEWFETGVPLGVVLTAMDEAFEQAREEGIGSLAYLRRPVARRFREFRDARLGTSDTADAAEVIPREEVLGFLEGAARSLRDTAARRSAPELDGIAATVAGLATRLRDGQAGLETIERGLQEADAAARESAERVVGRREAARLRETAVSALSPHRELMAPGIFDRTVERQYHRLLREALGLPELSLFAL